MKNERREILDETIAEREEAVAVPVVTAAMTDEASEKGEEGVSMGKLGRK